MNAKISFLPAAIFAGSPPAAICASTCAPPGPWQVSQATAASLCALSVACAVLLARSLVVAVVVRIGAALCRFASTGVLRAFFARVVARGARVATGDITAHAVGDQPRESEPKSVGRSYNISLRPPVIEWYRSSSKFQTRRPRRESGTLSKPNHMTGPIPQWKSVLPILKPPKFMLAIPPNWTCPDCGSRKEDFEMTEI